MPFDESASLNRTTKAEGRGHLRTVCWERPRQGIGLRLFRGSSRSHPARKNDCKPARRLRLDVSSLGAALVEISACGLADNALESTRAGAKACSAWSVPVDEMCWSLIRDGGQLPPASGSRCAEPRTRFSCTSLPLWRPSSSTVRARQSPCERPKYLLRRNRRRASVAKRAATAAAAQSACCFHHRGGFCLLLVRWVLLLLFVLKAQKHCRRQRARRRRKRRCQ
jgi:hypothetical protein